MKTINSLRVLSALLLSTILFGCNSFNTTQFTLVSLGNEGMPMGFMPSGFTSSRLSTTTQEEQEKQEPEQTSSKGPLLAMQDLVLCLPSDISALPPIPDIPLGRLGHRGPPDPREQEEIIIRHIEDLRSVLFKYRKQYELLRNGKHPSCLQYRVTNSTK